MPIKIVKEKKKDAYCEIIGSAVTLKLEQKFKEEYEAGFKKQRKEVFTDCTHKDLCRCFPIHCPFYNGNAKF